MATEKPVDANRANAEKSTGPTSAQGKAKSSRNAIRHGLTSRDLFVPPVQQAEFEAFQKELENALSPQGPRQMLLFNQILSAAWRLLRCDRAEAVLAARSAESGLDPLLDPSAYSALHVIERARAQSAKLLQKSITELRRIQTEDDYRAVAMPAGEGYETHGLGLADWQTIRFRLKKESLMDRGLHRQSTVDAINACMTSPVPPVVPSAAVARETDKTNPNQPAAPSAAERENTNPIPSTLSRLYDAAAQDIDREWLRSVLYPESPDKVQAAKAQACTAGA